MKRVRFGVVGCGGIVTFFQLPALLRCDHAEVVAVSDVDEQHARGVAERFNVPRWSKDYRDMIPHVDAVLIATPNFTHADFTCDFLQHGIHVLCEKPLATTVADVDRMLETARTSQARLMVGHSTRFSPNVTALKQFVADGTIGSVRMLSAGIGTPYANGVHRTDFRRQKALSGGGALIDLGVHLIDLALWLTTDSPTDVAYEATNDPEWEVEADAEVALEFRDGARAVFLCSFTRFLDNLLVVRGETGWIKAPFYDPTTLHVFGGQSRICQRAGLQRIMLPHTSEYDAQIEHFCTALLSDSEFIVRDHEVRAGLEIIERCYGGAALPKAAVA